MFSTLDNLLVAISGALGITESNFLNKNVFWENDVGYLSNSECYSLQTFDIVFITPENLLVGIYGSLGMKKTISPAKMSFEKMLWDISETVNARASKPLPLCSAPLKTY